MRLPPGGAKVVLLGVLFAACRSRSAVPSAPASALVQPSPTPAAVRRLPGATKAEEALAALRAASTDSDRAEAARSLRAIGITAEMQASLLTALDATMVTEFRVDLVKAIGEVPGAPEPVVRRLGSLIADSDRPVRRAARLGLIRAGSAAALVLPELIDALETPACEEAVVVLAQLGAAAAPAVPALFGVLDDAPQCRAPAVAEAIHSIRGESRAAEIR